MSQHTIQSEYHYIRVAITPAIGRQDELTLRKTFVDAVTETFGATSASTFLDILWIGTPENGKGSESIVRVSPEDTPKILASVVTYTPEHGRGLRLSVLWDSPFLPSLTRAASLFS
ncbi:hypothetical protein BKA70DRAFT_1266610 [Coprinopsis sp. MPI-PUGE-AT-0042]|nr:hypothetical protein BKA70DRAFT_1266610 [Coprinopsis sp. MPI-PUGE-AT-0042]